MCQGILLPLYPILIQTDDESDRDSPLVGALQHIHDIRMVRPSETSGDEGLDELAAHSGHSLLLGAGVF